MVEQHEQDMMIRKTFKGAKDSKTELFITVKKPESGECRCNWKNVKISPAPQWLENPVCQGCGKPAAPSKFYVGGMAVLVQIDEEEPKAYCDECRPNVLKKTCPTGCKHIFLEEARRPDGEYDNARWHDKIEWSVNGEKWYSVRYENIKGYLPYSASPQDVAAKHRDFMNALVTGKTIKVKAWYDKNSKVMNVNVSNFN